MICQLQLVWPLPRYRWLAQKKWRRIFKISKRFQMSLARLNLHQGISGIAHGYLTTKNTSKFAIPSTRSTKKSFLWTYAKSIWNSKAKTTVLGFRGSIFWKMCQPSIQVWNKLCRWTNLNGITTSVLVSRATRTCKQETWINFTKWYLTRANTNISWEKFSWRMIKKTKI